MNPKFLPPEPEGSLAAALDEVDNLLDDVVITIKYSAYKTPSPDGEVAWYIESIRRCCDRIEEMIK